MGYGFKTSFKDTVIILFNLMVVLILNVFYMQISTTYVLAFIVFIIFEIIITVALLQYGETVLVIRYAVLGSTLVFVVMITALALVQQCCSASKALWISLLIVFIIIRLLYVLRLHFMAELCRKDFVRKSMSMPENQIYSMTSVPIETSRIVPTYPQHRTAPEYRSPPQSIGFENVAMLSQTPSSSDNKSYGWSV